MSIQAVFDKHSAEYDATRRKLIPCFDDLYNIAIATIPCAKQSPIRVLDLGAGTGLLSEMAAAAYPRAEITLVDVAGKMLGIAKTRLRRWSGRIRYREEDYSQGPMREKYQVILSSLSIHHLKENEKRTLFEKCYHALVPEGIFINADQVLGETPDVERRYREQWLEQVRKNGVSEEELGAAFERMREDNMSPLSCQLSYLKEAGFSDVTCWYKNYSFVVYSGLKK